MIWTFEDSPLRRNRDEVLHLKSDLQDHEVLVREVVQNSLDAGLGQPAVRVRFVLRELTGARKASFLRTIGIEEYRRHAEASRRYELRLQESAGGNKSNDPVISEDALAAMDPDDPAAPLRLLLVEDYRTTGLTGDELDTFAASRFCACCRDSEFSVKRKRESGGSFGKGKNVVWFHSSTRLVLFSSRLSEPFEGDVDRFIGVGKLPWHVQGAERFAGRADLGGKGAHSLRGAEARALAGRLGLERLSQESGTSICIVGFDLPAEVGRPADVIRKCVEDYYWPAMFRGHLEVEIVDEASGRTEEADPSSREDLQPFVKAMSNALDDREEVMKTKDFPVPPRVTAEGRVESGVAVACELLDDERDADVEHVNHVALVRGFGMVVAYREIKPQRINARNYAGVCLAGMAHPKATLGSDGHPSPAERLESLLAHSEPEAHDKWSPQNFQAGTWRGAQKTVNDILRFVKEAVTELAGGTVTTTSGASLPELSRRFRIGGGTESHERSLSIRQIRKPEVGNDGLVHYSVAIGLLKDGGDVGGQLRVRLSPNVLDSVSGRSASTEPIAIAAVRIEGGTAEPRLLKDDTVAELTIPLVDAQLPVRIEVAATPPPEIAGGRSHFALDVSAAMEGGA